MKRLLCALTLFISSQAQAGILFEPYAGFSFGSGEDAVAPITKYEQNAPFLGARLGYQILGAMAGLDYTMGMESDIESTTSGVTDKYDADHQSLGVFVGYNLPIMLRGWVSYYLSSKVSFNSGAANGDELKGSGSGFGLGLTPLPLLSMNLEYRMHTFDEAKDGTTGTTTKLSGASAIDYNQIMFSLSLPLDF